MTTALVVDDSVVDRRRAGGILEKLLDLKATYAADGAEALALIGPDTPDIVITDLQMPEMNGLELVREIRSRYPSLPVILTTAHGSEEVAAEALRSGAASYVPKRATAADFAGTVERVLELVAASQRARSLARYLTRETYEFLLENEPTIVSPLVAQLQHSLSRIEFCDETELMQIGTALDEALLNALFHGNLEVSSELREEDDRAYYDLAAQRARQEPYCDRRVHVHVELSPEEAVFVIRDEGPGFDPGALPDPTDPANLGKMSGRGLLLIQAFMDEVTHNEPGNEIKMVKRRSLDDLEVL